MPTFWKLDGDVSPFWDYTQKGVLVVSGSRELPEQIATAYAKTFVGIAISRGWALAVGDARGFDTAIINEAADKLPLLVVCASLVGLRAKLPPTDTPIMVVTVQNGRSSTTRSCFIERDRALAQIGAQALKKGFLGCWNGISAGTKKTAEFCEAAGIKGRMYKTDGTHYDFGA